MSLNATLASYLLDIRDQYDPDSNSYRTYNKAYRSMLAHKDDIYNVEEAGHVFGVGKVILRMLANRLEKDMGAGRGAGSAAGPSRPWSRSYVPEGISLDNPFFDPSLLDVPGLGVRIASTTTARGRGRGRSAGTTTSTRGAGRGRGKRARPDDGAVPAHLEGSPTKKRSPGKSGTCPAGVVVLDEDDAWAVPDPIPGFGCAASRAASSETRFWYLDTSHNRVSHYSEAEIHIVAPFVLRKVELPIPVSAPPPLPVPFKLIYLEGQPLWTKTQSRVAWVEEERLVEKRWETCCGFDEILPRPVTSYVPAHPPPAAPRNATRLPPGEDLTALLDQEARTKIRTLDPSRTGRSRTDPTPRSVPAASSDDYDVFSNPIDIRRAAADAALRRHQAENMASSATSKPTSTLSSGEKTSSDTASTSVPGPSTTDSAAFPRTADAPSFGPKRRVSVAHLSFPTFEPIIIPADTYDIVLILDNREIGRYGNRDALKDGLEKLGVQAVQRPLAVGDTVWIARSRSNGRECVLNWIIERKRLDDLCASIKDSRFQDQKLRLAQSGLLHVFYLVEHFAVQRLMQSHELMINTALSRTQVVDEFQVKETRSQQETVEFLASMHSAIQMMLAGQDLHVLPSSVVSRPTYMAFQAHLRESEPEIDYLISWSDFQTINGKNATRTVGDTWARMLLSVRGISAERASKILEKYGTARALWEAYGEAEAADAQALLTADAASASKSKKRKPGGPKTMLADLGGEGRRRLGDALSTKIWEVVRSCSYV